MKSVVDANVGRNESCPCGSGRKFKHCCVVRPNPVIDVNSELMRAFSCYQTGRLDEMEGICRRVLQAYPQQADALHLLGLLSQQRGDLDKGLALIDRALSLGGNDSMHANRAMVLNALRRHDDAIQAAMKALQLNRSGTAAWGHLGVALQSLERWGDAEAAYVQLLRLTPGNAAALNCIGYGLLRQRRYEEARKVLDEACRLDPQLLDAQINLGKLLRESRRYPESEACYRRVLAVNPNRADVWFQLGAVFTNMNRVGEAKAAFSRSFELEPSPLRLLRKTLILSHVYASREAMVAERDEFDQGLDALLTAEISAAAPDEALFSPAIFNLAYQGHDVLPALRKLARLYLRMSPELKFRAAHVDKPRAVERPLRVGFFSVHIEDHSVSRCYAPMIRALAMDPKLEVFLISNRALAAESVRNPYASFTGTFVKVPQRIVEARRQIAALELDVLIYQDIGMDESSYFLAYSRLARRQCVLGGHPVTTGLPEMDIYVSSALGEPSEAQEHYSERLVLFDTVTALFEKPKLPARFKAREELGLPSDGALYVCPMMLQKLHPDFDAVLAEILRRDLNGHIVLFGHHSAGWETDLAFRLDRSVPASVRDRIIIIPWVSDHEDFAAINKHAAVVLDPFHFGIGSTAVTTFAVGTPIVTWPGAFLRGRVGLIYSRLLNIEECVATEPQDYVERAVLIAHDAELRARLSARILANQDRFFDGQVFLESTRRFLCDLKTELDDRSA